MELEGPFSYLQGHASDDGYFCSKLYNN